MIASYLLRLDGVCCTDSSRFDWTRTAVTASTPLMVSEDMRDSVAAVVGLQMTYRTFYEFFANATSVCPRDLATSSSAAANCNLTCASLVTPFSHSRSVSLFLCLCYRRFERCFHKPTLVRDFTLSLILLVFNSPSLLLCYYFRAVD